MNTEIIIEFDLSGEVSLEGKGFVGKSCDEAMEVFEKALGLVTDRHNKPEYLRVEVKTNAKQRA